MENHLTFRFTFVNLVTKTEFHYFGTIGTLLDMLSHENMTTPIKDARTGESYTIKQAVFDGLKIDASALENIDYQQ